MKIIETMLAFTGTLAKRSGTNNIVLHHAAAKMCDAKTIHYWHLGNGWAGIGYHFVVRKDGSIERGRPIDKIGAHASGHNSKSIGICFEGNFQEETMSDVQLKAGQELIAYLLKLYKLKRKAVVRHKDLMSTSCPGKNFPFDEMVASTEVLSTTSTMKTNDSETHTIAKGDTLYSLAKKYHTTVDKLATLNGLKFPYTLTIGKTLKLKAYVTTAFEGYNVQVTAKSGLNIRKGPGTIYRSIGALSKGTKVFVSKEKDGWGYVKTKVKTTSVEGWIALSCTKKVR